MHFIHTEIIYLIQDIQSKLLNIKKKQLQYRKDPLFYDK